MRLLIISVCLVLASCSKCVETKTKLSMAPPASTLLCRDLGDITDDLKESAIKLTVSCSF